MQANLEHGPAPMSMPRLGHGKHAHTHTLFVQDQTNHAPVNLNHFRLLRVVGKGAFGKVRIVERKDTGLTFALKYIRKDEGRSAHARRLLGRGPSHADLVSQSYGRKASATLSASAACSSISTTRFSATCATASRTLNTCIAPRPARPRHDADHARYIVVDLMNGGDLRFHISRKTFTEDAVRFWIAELGCAVRYIHQQGIVHRDIKPDNVLLDSEGHVHLADFVSSTCNPMPLPCLLADTLRTLPPTSHPTSR